MSPKNAAKAQEAIQDQTVEPIDDQTVADDAKPKLTLVVSDEDEEPGDAAEMISDGSPVSDTGPLHVAEPVTPVQTAKFAQLGQSQVAMDQHSMDLLMDVDLDLSVELGRAAVPVREILQLGSGSIVELNKLAGDSVDILVNGRLIARGEVVVVDENFGVRITEILSPTDRISRLG